MQTGVASRAGTKGGTRRKRAGVTSSHPESLKIAFIYRGDPRHRTANRLSMLKNVAAAARLGHEVSLLIPREGMTAAEAEGALASALEDFDIPESFPLVRVPRATVRGRGRRGFDFLSACWARARGFDLVWSREFHAADFASAFGLPTVFEHHHPFNERQWKVARRMLARESFKGVVAISDVHRRTLTEGGLPEEKVVTAHSGVDLSQFERSKAAIAGLRRALGAAARPLVVYAGSLYAGKGCEQILSAARELPEALFVCVGGRDFEVEQLSERAAASGLTNVELTGRVPHAEVPSYLLAADILIAPFTEDGRDVAGKVIIPFASPIKLFEYMAAGRAVVTSNVGAIPEVLRNEENALLVEPGSVAELVGAIKRLLNDKALTKRLGAAARRDVQGYSWEARVTRVLDFARGESRAAAVV
ncbi:MAG TPA: glycosyltransferase family 4 protein [Pyrinomonadaceae bacterium]|jgi:glycosyltransferase involved in cell wall biosynthesis|nr:glycosyltransferase family 4 protein [Pyrinomonadaceae bacterium]